MTFFRTKHLAAVGVVAYYLLATNRGVHLTFKQHIDLPGIGKGQPGTVAGSGLSSGEAVPTGIFPVIGTQPPSQSGGAM